MATRTKEEERLLDEKIARIQKKNEEILRREKEIEEDKRLAAKQNAIVQLRSTSTNDSRERTPALRLSKRESEKNPLLETGDSADIYSKNSENTTPRGRGGRRGRERADRNDNGPPPDPRSYLADSERDPIPPSRDGKGDRGDEFRNKRGGRGEERGSSKGGREFQRGGRRGQGKPERGRGRNEDAWRAERNRIDEERIQRQKSSDGSWRREWDNEKIEQELDEGRYDGTRSGMNNAPRVDRWKSNYSQQSNQRSEFEFDRPNRGSRGGRSHRGRPDNYDQLCLEKSVPHSREQHYAGKSPRHSAEDWGHKYGGKSPFLSRESVDDHVFAACHAEEPVLMKRLHNHPVSDKTQYKGEKGIVKTIDNGIPKPILKNSTERSVIDVGGSFKVLVSNTDATLESATASSKTPRRPNHDLRHRHKSQASYSSQSEDEAHMSPRDREHHFSRNQYPSVSRNHKIYSKISEAQHLKPVKKRQLDADISNKPPLPSFKSKSAQEISNQDVKKETEDGEESWEDVTTSGTESMGEDNIHSSPNKAVNTFTANENLNENITMECMYTPEDFLIMQRYEDTDIEHSINFYSRNNAFLVEEEARRNAEYIEEKLKENLKTIELRKKGIENKENTNEAEKLVDDQEKTDSVKSLTSNEEDFKKVENMEALNISDDSNSDLKEFERNDKHDFIQTSNEMPETVIEDKVKAATIENTVNNEVKESETKIDETSEKQFAVSDEEHKSVTNDTN